MNISEAIRKELEVQNISQSDLARRLGTSRQYINNSLRYWEENGISNIHTLRKWADAIGVDYKKFLKYM